MNNTVIKTEGMNFLVNREFANNNNDLAKGKFIGIYSDKCLYNGPYENIVLNSKEEYLQKRSFSTEQNITEFLENLSEWKKCGVDLITLGLQNRDIIDREDEKSKKHKLSRGAYITNGSLDENFLYNLEYVIDYADRLGLAVLVNLFDLRCFGNFTDDYFFIESVYNILDWFSKKKFSNVLLNLVNSSYTQYKTSFLMGERLIEFLAGIRKKYKEELLIGAGLIPSLTDGKLLIEYIKNSDFIPVFEKNKPTTKTLYEYIFFYRIKMKEAGRELPIIIAKGDDLSERHNTYGETNLVAAMENGVSWCYFEEGKPNYRDGFDTLPINWSIGSCNNKKRLCKTIKKIKPEV